MDRWTVHRVQCHACAARIFATRRLADEQAVPLATDGVFTYLTLDPLEEGTA